MVGRRVALVALLIVGALAISSYLVVRGPGSGILGALGLLREVAAQVNCRSTVYEDWGFRRRMSRGLGISALFAGEMTTLAR